MTRWPMAPVRRGRRKVTSTAKASSGVLPIAVAGIACVVAAAWRWPKPTT